MFLFNRASAQKKKEAKQKLKEEIEAVRAADIINSPELSAEEIEQNKKKQDKEDSDRVNSILSGIKNEKYVPEEFVEKSREEFEAEKEHDRTKHLDEFETFKVMKQFGGPPPAKA